MARTEAGATLTRQHQRQQLRLRVATIEDLQRLWPGWSLDDFGSFDRVAGAAAVLARERHRSSATLAVNYYETFRDLESVEGLATPRIAPRLNTDEATGYIRGAGLSGVINARRRGEPMESAKRNGLVKASGAVSHLVMQGGRDSVLRSTRADRQTLGYQRVTGADPCAFCVMMSSRGPVYKDSSEESAGFQPHESCECHPEPVYRGGEWNERNREHRDTWEQAQREAREAGELQRGTKNDQLNALRRFLNQ